MNDNARKWVEALRSGEFSQTRSVLRDENSYCCLGVACEVYRRETGEGEWRGAAFAIRNSESMTILPEDVCTWLGLRTPAGDYRVSELTGDNDTGSTFDEIADTIESQPDGLFEEGSR